MKKNHVDKSQPKPLSVKAPLLCPQHKRNFSLLAIIVALSCLIAACFSHWQGGDEGTFSITIGGGGRALLPWDASTDISALDHTISLTDGPGPNIRREGVKAGQTAQFAVAPGHWEIAVRAYLGGVLKAEGFKSVDVTPGRNGAVSVSMGQPFPTTWTAVEDSKFGEDYIYSIAYVNNMFLAGGRNGKMAYSSDGVTWTAVADTTFGPDSNNNTYSVIYAIAYGNGKFVAVGSNGSNTGKMAYSTDGKTWTSVTQNAFDSGVFTLSIAYGNGKFVAVGFFGKMAYSMDGVTWTPVGTSTFGTNEIAAIAYGNDKFVAAGEGGKMAHSDNGIDWTQIPNNPFAAVYIHAIAYGNGKFVALGGGGKMAYSTDGLNWIPVEDTTFGSSHINDIAWGNGMFVAVGGDNVDSEPYKMAYSSNGINWTPIPSDVIYVRLIACGNGRFVIVNGNNTIWYSGK